MGVLKDSCFHQLGEPEVSGDPHEELIPFSIISSIIQHPSLSSAVFSISNIPHRSKGGNQMFEVFFLLLLSFFRLLFVPQPSFFGGR